MSPNACPNCAAPFPGETCTVCGARQGVVWEPPAASKRGRPEAVLERYVLRALGSYPDVLVMKNEVGVGYTNPVVPVLCAEIDRMAREGELSEACAGAVKRAIGRTAARHRITYGLGVGSPDLVAVIRGQWHGIELKSEEGRVSPEQRQWHDAAERRGAPTHIARTVSEARAVVERVRAGG